MGVVYEAEDTITGRRVALKAILASRRDPVSSERFRREALAVQGLAHRNIVGVHDHGEDDGTAWIAMEFVNGVTLDAILRGRAKHHPLSAMLASPPRSIDDVRGWVRLIVQASRGLHEAHESGLLHRDVKPSNLLVTDDGVVKVADFGLARHEARGDTLTNSREVMGTLQYMAPELFSSDRRTADRRTDIYALGITLYEAICGVRPVDETSADIFIHKVQAVEPKRPSAHSPHIPRDLETICLKSIHIDPASRYGTAAEFADDLERWLDGKPVLARPEGNATRWVRYARRHKTRLVAAVVIVLLLVVTSFTLAKLNRQQRDENQREAKFKLESSLMRAPGGWSPQGQKLIDEALVLDPTLDDAILQRGWVRFSGGDTAGALADFDEGLRRNPNDAAFVFAKKAVLGLTGRTTEAQAISDSLRFSNTTSPIRLAIVGFLANAIGRNRVAIEAFQAAKSQRPAWSQSRFGIAYATLGMCRDADAVDAAKSFLDLEPSHVAGQAVLALARIRLADQARGPIRNRLDRELSEQDGRVAPMAQGDPLWETIRIGVSLLDASPDVRAEAKAASQTLWTRLTTAPADLPRVAPLKLIELLAMLWAPIDMTEAMKWATQAVALRPTSHDGRFVLALAVEASNPQKAAEIYGQLTMEYPDLPYAHARRCAIARSRPAIISQGDAWASARLLATILPSSLELLADAGAVLAAVGDESMARLLADYLEQLGATLGNEVRANELRAQIPMIR